MMRWIVGSSLKFRFIVVALAVAMMYFGYGQVRQMPVDVFPEFAPPLVNIQTPAIGLSTEEVESLVTIPLEESLTGIPDIDVMRSKSVPQLSEIILIFDRGTDLLNARQLVQERLDQVSPSLPAFVTPPAILQPLSSTSRMMKIGMQSDQMDLIDLSMVAEFVVRPQLMQIPGVANVAIWGQRKDMVHIRFDPDRLRDHGVTLDQVMEASADAT
ncbi:MAG: efflux RND transporter permease subunit, partial [Dehalococcoidia bacterium]